MPLAGIVMGVNETRSSYLLAAGAAVELLAEERTAKAWDSPSVLEGMSVGVLAAHLARSVLQVGWFLDGDVLGNSLPVPASTYYARLTDTTSRSSALNQGVQTRSAETAAKGASDISVETREALALLRHRFELEGDDRRVAVAHRPGEELLLLDEYLATRLVELSVHIEDLSLSVGSTTEAPLAAVTRAVDVLVAAARERHGDRAVLHALSRRERDERSALRVL